MPHLTISDIAKMAGVSTTAVSFVLNDRPGVSDATREKVKEIIRQTGFTPNVHTRRLNLGKSFTIHVVLRQYGQNLYNQFALETLSGIFAQSKALGYSIMFTFVDDQMDCEQIIDSVRNKDCDGVILYQVADKTLISLLQQEDIPFVCVDSHLPLDGKLPLVEVDYFDAAYQATKHLYSCGHRDIGFIGPEVPTEYYLTTFNGYTAALKDCGLSCNPGWLFQLRYTEDSIETTIEQLLSQEKLPTAIFCAGDSHAINTIHCIKEKGLRIPEDISIMGLDDLFMSRYIDPPLSTMTFDKELVGERAMRLLYRIMTKQEYEPVRIIKTKPVERSSVKKI